MGVVENSDHSLDRKILTHFGNVNPIICFYFRHTCDTMGGTWDHGLLGCFDNIGICIAAFIAPCWVAVSLVFLIFTACKRRCGKVMFLHVSVFPQGGVYPSHNAMGQRYIRPTMQWGKGASIPQCNG